MAVGSSDVVVEEVGHRELAKANLQSTRGYLSRKGEGPTRNFHLVLGKWDDLLKHQSCNIRSGADLRVTYDIQIGEPGQPQGAADASPSGLFDVEIKDRIGRELVSSEKRQDTRRGMFGMVLQAVGPTVCGVEISVCLEDEVRLPRDPPFRGVGVLKESIRRSGRGWWSRVRRPILRPRSDGQERRSTPPCRECGLSACADDHWPSPVNHVGLGRSRITKFRLYSPRTCQPGPEGAGIFPVSHGLVTGWLRPRLKIRVSFSIASSQFLIAYWGRV